MKKLLSVLLLAAMVVSVASCADDEAGSKGSTAGNTTISTTTVATTTNNPFGDFTTDPSQVPEDPFVSGDPQRSLEALIEGKTGLSASGKIDMNSLRDEGFDCWQAGEEFKSMFDGVDTAVEFAENGNKGKCGGGIQSGTTKFYFSLTEQAKVSAYVITTGNDNSDFPGRNPMEWWLYATNDESKPLEEWDVIDYVYDGMITDTNFTPHGYEVDADKQGDYQHYCWVIGYINHGAFQVGELELYTG